MKSPWLKSSRTWQHQFCWRLPLVTWPNTEDWSTGNGDWSTQNGDFNHSFHQQKMAMSAKNQLDQLRKNGWLLLTTSRNLCRSSQNSDISPANSTKHFWSSPRIPGDGFPAIEWEEKLGFHGGKNWDTIYIYIHYIYIPRTSIDTLFSARGMKRSF